MDKFLNIYNIPRIRQEEVDNINIVITSNKTVSVKNKQKNSQQTKVQGTDSKVNSTKHLRKKITPILLKLLQ